MKISVVYALPKRQIVRELELPAGATVDFALQESRLLQEFPAIDPGATLLGIYGVIVSVDTVLQHGDRLEIYRPLNVEPKEARRLRGSKR